MAWMTYEQVKEIVRKALNEVADFSDDAAIENFTFDKWHDFHKKVFLCATKRGVLSEPYHTHGGGTASDSYYDVALTTEQMNPWFTLGDCIAYLHDNQASYLRPKEDKVIM